jgi:hypothetical protein
MRIGGEVPGGGSILLGVSKAMSECGVPRPRIVNAKSAMDRPAQVSDIQVFPL